VSYLVDANILSEMTKPAPDAKVVEWLSAHEAELVIDPIILGELCTGILALPAGRKRTQLEQWFAAVVEAIDCLAWDSNVSLRWASLVVGLRRKGDSLPILDSMIAATALTHNLTVATHNIRDFERCGARVVDPFAG
jgi:predicted nucleic acid-binding protein